MTRLFEPVEDGKIVPCNCGDESCYTSIEVIDDVLIIYEDASDRDADLITVTLPDGYALCVSVADVPKPDWSQAPAWANWWAVDPNGWAHWFQEEPVLALTITYCGWVPKTINGVQQGAELWAAEYDLPLGLDWRTLKHQRPQATEMLRTAMMR